MTIIEFTKRKEEKEEKKILKLLKTMNNALWISSWPYINGDKTDEESERKLNSDPCILWCNSAYRGINYELAVYPVDFNSDNVKGGFIKKKSYNSWKIQKTINNLPRHSDLKYLSIIEDIRGEILREKLTHLSKGELIELEYLPGIKRIGFFRDLKEGKINLFQGKNNITGQFESCNQLTLNRQYYKYDISPLELDLAPTNMNLVNPDINLVQRIKILKF